MGGTIDVHVTTLRALATQLSDLARLLDEDNDKGTRIGDWVSDPKIGSALSNIQHDWSHKRGEVVAYLKSVSQGAAAAAEAYDATADRHIAKAAQD